MQFNRTLATASIVLSIVPWGALAYVLYGATSATGEARDLLLIALGIWCIGLVASVVYWRRAGSGDRAQGGIADLARRLVQGDLTSSTLPGGGAGVAGDLSQAVDKLKQTLKQFSHSSVLLDHSAQHLDRNLHNINHAADQIVSQLNTSASASEQLSAAAAEVAKNCKAASDNTYEANEVALQGQAIVNKTIETMHQTTEIVNDSAGVIRTLGERSGEIGQIIELISSIADQTNLLALNAAIEAARAGEQGRGFAVVSDEVRQLAAKTTEATERIRGTVEAMQSELNRAVHAMQKGVSVVQAGADEAQKSEVALSDILTHIASLVGEIEQIAVASRQTTATTEELSGSLHQVAKLMDETAGNVNQNGQIVTRLSASAKEMKHLIGQFRLVTKTDAEALVHRAYDYVQQHGREKALAVFNDPEGEFVQGELYVLVQNFDGMMLAHGGNPDLIGKNLAHAKDASGKLLCPALVRVAREQGQGWYSYGFMNPHTGRTEPKHSFVKRLGDDCYIACGIYQPDV